MDTLAEEALIPQPILELLAAEKPLEIIRDTGLDGMEKGRRRRRWSGLAGRARF